MQAVGSVLRHWRNKSAARNTTNYAVGSNTQKKKAQVMTNRCAGDIWLWRCSGEETVFKKTTGTDNN